MMSKLRRISGGRRAILRLFAVLSAGAVAMSGATLKITGTGWWENRTLKRDLINLRPEIREGTIDANALEDVVFYVMTHVASRGFLEPEVEALVRRADGSEFTHRFDSHFTQILPRPLQAEHVELRVKRGVRYRFAEVTVTGSEPVMSTERAQELIVAKLGLLNSAANQVFTPERLQTGLGRIELVLRDEGYAEAVARVTTETRDPSTGRVAVDVEVDLGPRWDIGTVEVIDPENIAADVDLVRTGVWNQTWEQDQMRLLRNAYLEAGYPDVRVDATAEPENQPGESRLVAVRFVVQPGPRVIAGPVRFEGAGDVRAEVMNRRVLLGAGEPLDTLAVEQARRRLSRLRAFRRVTVRYEPRDGATRAPVFHLQRRPPWETSLLFGWGSYERLRGGVEFAGNNLFNRAHTLRVEAMASTLSQRGEAVYTVPEIYGETVDANVRLFGLDREEFAFTREEFGGSVSVSHRELPVFDAVGTVGYTFQNLRSSDNELGTARSDLVESRSGSLTFTLNRDRRDNPLTPREGLRWFTQLEWADQALGGEVAYQRLELGASWHRPVTDTAWLHVGVSHGTVWTLGEDSDANLPVNKRFYPGGEHSYRGVPNGEGVPINANGDYVGAKTFTLVNLEVEQALTERLNVVLFYDGLAASARLDDSPWDDMLHAVGAGLRYDLFIGPVRLEYGHNLNPRPVDPSGTWHFSLGFPF
jgi:outer membrane protein assembly factor BamA